jgi:hypothetical protein
MERAAATLRHGTFRNLRLFARQADGQRWVMWFNKQLAAL